MTGEDQAADSLSRLVSAWRSVTTERPFVLSGDREAVSSWPDQAVVHESFASYCSDASFGLQDERLHVGLVPIPYIGSLASADVFLLMLNPGLSPVDYFAEEHFPEYRELLLDNLHQRLRAGFPFLDPALSWHSGGEYWLSRFRELAIALRPQAGSFKDALRFLAKHVACLELVPYHSPQFGLPSKLVESLESVRLMLDYVQMNLAPRAARGEVLLVVTRQIKRWGLEESTNVVLYRQAESRGGHISPATRGGKAILRFLDA